MIAIDTPIAIKHVRGTEPGASALFSADELHRYGLERSVCGKGFARLVAIGMNPSTADAFKPDPTVTRELGFARVWGCEQYSKGNLYGWRETKPAVMWGEHRAGRDIVGPHNDDAIRTMLTMLKRDGGIALACWGRMHAKGDRALQEMRVLAMCRLAGQIGIQWQCLGKNQDGSPKHPLYLPANTKLEPWPG